MVIPVLVERGQSFDASRAGGSGGIPPFGTLLVLDCFPILSVFFNGCEVQIRESVALFAELRPAVLFRRLARWTHGESLYYRG